ncbi:ftsK/SpoIIIE family protein [Mycobacterium xenopi 3993]|nr:ftsK/SpoIIIE family protein [Mycobacterium xenopi 3993]
MVVATAQRGKSTTLMTLMTSAALMYRPERVTFFCIGASLYPVEELPHVAGVVSLNDTEGVSRTIATIEGLIRAREASFKHYQIDISEFRERRFGPRAAEAPTPRTNSATFSWSSTTTATSMKKTRPWATVPSPSPGRACPTGCT